MADTRRPEPQHVVVHSGGLPPVGPDRLADNFRKLVSAKRPPGGWPGKPLKEVQTKRGVAISCPPLPFHSTVSASITLGAMRIFRME